MLKFFELLNQIDRNFGFHLCETQIEFAGDTTRGLLLLDAIEGVLFSPYNDLRSVGEWAKHKEKTQVKMCLEHQDACEKARERGKATSHIALTFFLTHGHSAAR